MDLQSLIDHPSKLPTVPRVAQRVIASLKSETVKISEIADLIEADPVLSANLLRLANSAYFQVSRSVDTVGDAIQILGITLVRQLVLMGGMVSSFNQTPGIDLHQFWTHSLYTACAARWLAEHCAVNPELAFTLGLMQGIGELHLHSAAPSAMVALDKRVHILAAERLRHEADALGFNYLNVSAALARLWNFPDSLIEPLAQIGDPLATPAFAALAAVVHLGMWCARHEVLATSKEEMSRSYPHAIGDRLGLDCASVLPRQNRELGTTQKKAMPTLHELANGLDAMLG